MKNRRTGRRFGGGLVGARGTAIVDDDIAAAGKDGNDAAGDFFQMDIVETGVCEGGFCGDGDFDARVGVAIGSEM